VSTTNCGINNNCENSNILQKEDNLYAPKSFIARNNEELDDKIVFTREYSSSFTGSLTQNKNKNLLQQDYFSNIKQHEEKKMNLIMEMDSKAEDSNNYNYTFKRETKDSKGDISIVINGNDKDNYFDQSNSRNNADLGFKHFNGEKILLKHSLRKNKTPKFLLSPKKCLSKQDLGIKHFNHSNAEIIPEKASFISINKDTISKYKFLFSDVDDVSSKSIRAYDKKFNNSKNLSQFCEDGDFTNLQKYGTVYSTSKANTSNILATEADSKIMNSIARKAGISSVLLTESTTTNILKDI